MECLDKIIGISQSTCECLAEGRPEDYNESASGVYLDQLEGFNAEQVKYGDDCARGGYWERADLAINNAKLDLKTDLLRCINTTYKPRIDTLNTTLGNTGFSGTANLNTQYAGVRIIPFQIKSGFIYIKRIGILINQNAAVTIKVVSNENNGTVIYESTPINANANTLTWAAPAEPIELPMWSYSTNVRYSVLMELSGSFRPKENKKDCGCGGVQRPYLRYLDFEGTKGNDITNIDSFTNTSGVNGLVLDIEVKCKASDIICSSERPLDYSDESGALGMAYAIRFRAAAKMYEEVLSSMEINRPVLMNREEMAKRVAYWNNEYMSWITYLCGTVEMDTNGCFVCRQVQTSLSKNTITATGTVNKYPRSVDRDKFLGWPGH